MSKIWYNIGMKIISSNFIANQQIPIKYTCDGEGLMPEISWSDLPPETKSFALIIEDPDAPMDTYVHFLVVNIPKNVTKIAQGTNISGADMIPNTSGKTSYIPPCPPSGSHRYIFKIFALDIEKLENVTKDDLYQLIKPHILDQAQITTLYSRNH